MNRLVSLWMTMLVIVLLGTFALPAHADPTVSLFGVDSAGKQTLLVKSGTDYTLPYGQTLALSAVNGSSTVAIDAGAIALTSKLANPAKSSTGVWSFGTAGHYLIHGACYHEATPERQYWPDFQDTVLVKADPKLVFKLTTPSVTNLPGGEGVSVTISNSMTGTTATNLVLITKIVGNTLNLGASATNCAYTGTTLDISKLVYITGSSQLAQPSTASAKAIKDAYNVTTTLGNLAGGTDLKVTFLLAKKASIPVLDTSGKLTPITPTLSSFDILYANDIYSTVDKTVTTKLKTTDKSLTVATADAYGLCRNTLNVGSTSTILTLNFGSIALPINADKSVTIGDLIGLDGTPNNIKHITGTLAIGTIKPVLTVTTSQTAQAANDLITVNVANAGNTATGSVTLSGTPQGGTLNLKAVCSQTTGTGSLVTPYLNPILRDWVKVQNAGATGYTWTMNTLGSIPLNNLSPGQTANVQFAVVENTAATGINVKLTVSGSNYTMTVSNNGGINPGVTVAVTGTSTTLTATAIDTAGHQSPASTQTVTKAATLLTCNISRTIDGATVTLPYLGSLKTPLVIGTLTSGNPVTITGTLSFP